MTGRSVHDVLLRVLSDGALRARLIEGETYPTDVPSAEWEVLTHLARERLLRMSRFLARHYYRERMVRLFRHIRKLVPHTGRDPLAILQTPEAQAVMDQGVLGSTASAEFMLALIESFLLANDPSIVELVPYWRDLVRYQGAMFLAEASGRAEGSAHPRRAASARIVDLNWDIPAVVAQLRKPYVGPPQAVPKPISLLIVCSRRGQVTTIRCSKDIRRLVESADGTRDIDQLSMLAGLPVQQTERVLRQMEALGAIGWNAVR